MGQGQKRLGGRCRGQAARLVFALLLAVFVVQLAPEGALALPDRAPPERTEPPVSGEPGRDQVPYFEEGREVIYLKPPDVPRDPATPVPVTVEDGGYDPKTNTLAVELPGGEVRSVRLGRIEGDPDGFTDAAAGDDETDPCKTRAGAGRAECIEGTVGSTEDSGERVSDGTFMGDTYHSMFGECWMCTFMAAFTLIGDQFAREVYVIFAGPLTTLISVFFGLWLLLQGTKLFFPDFADNPARILMNIAIKSLMFSIVMFMLAPPTFFDVSPDSIPGGDQTFFDWGPDLVLGAGAGAASAIGTRINEINGNELRGLAESPDHDIGDGTDPVAGGSDIECGAWDTERVGHVVSDGALGDGEGAISTGTLKQMTCMVHQMQITAGFGLAVAAQMFDLFDTLNPVELLVSIFLEILPAAILAFTFGIALISFAFYMMDAIVRISVMSALAPILMGMLLFPPTRDMAITGFRVILSGGASLLGIAMVFGIGGVMMSVVPAFVLPWDTTPPNMVDMLNAMADGGELAEQDYELYGDFTILNSGFWYLLLSGILINKLLKKVGELIKTILETASSDPDSMGAGSQALLGYAGKAAVIGGGTFAIASATTGRNMVKDLAARRAGEEDPGHRKSGPGFFGSLSRARLLMGRLGGRNDDENLMS